MGRIVFFIIILFIGITVFLSYKYSLLVYPAYLKIYYDKMYTEKELCDKAQKMYDSEMYEELRDLLKNLLFIYPGNNEFKRIGALNYIKLGDIVRSAEILALLDDDYIRQSPVFEEILKNLYYNGYYSDVLSFYNRKIMLDNINAAFYYGVSLYKKGRYDESYKMLMDARYNKSVLPEVNFYIGLNLEKKGDKSEAVKYVKAALDADKSNREYKKKLAELYGKTNMFKEAESLLRGRKG